MRGLGAVTLAGAQGVKAAPFGTRDMHDPERGGVLRAPAGGERLHGDVAGHHGHTGQAGQPIAVPFPLPGEVTARMGTGDFPIPGAD
jgi:hypothetical protein